MKKIEKNGFTLIEVMVVMAIIAILAVLIIGAIQLARRESIYTQARSEMKDIVTIINSYSFKYKEFPPRAGGGYSTDGDCCSACYDSTDPNMAAAWMRAVNDMRDSGYINQEMADKFATDPWGTPYAYDDNYGQVNPEGVVTKTFLCSYGPDGRRGKNGANTWPGQGDDECMNLDHEAVELWSH